MRSSELKHLSKERYAQMPAHLQYKPSHPNRRALSASLFSLQIALYQEYLLNNFLLDRLPGCGSSQSKQDLIDTARKMLDGILVLCANQDKLTNYSIGFVWAITYSGILSAAILSIELLKQSKFPQEWPLILRRSEVIQNLSMFIGCLEWVRPSESNHTLCVCMRKVIERILDQVLELPLPNPCQVKSTRPDPGPAPDELAISSMFAPEDEQDFLDWLNSVDWTRDMLQDAWT